MSQEVHVSRKMGTRDVTVHITDESVGVSTLLGDYMEMLAEEMGNPTTLMTVSGMKKRMLEASYSLNEKMKSEVKPWANLVRR